jgi:glycosyltransferase involved in cell wall biosynthesis
MRILYIDQTAELGGAEFSLFSEVTGLPYQATVILFQDGPFKTMLQEAGITVEVLHLSKRATGVRKKDGLGRVLFAIPAVVWLVLLVAGRARRHDLIYANSQKAFVVGALAAILTGRKLVWRLRDVLAPSHFGWLLSNTAVRLANWKASKVIANSAATGRAFVAAGGAERLVAVAYPGIDPAPFDRVTQAEVAAARAELAAGESKLVGIFGRLCHWKGQLVFVEAISQLPDVVGVIVGGPLFGEEAFEAALRVRIAELGIAGRVRMLGFRRDVPCLMKAMDVIVHASTAPEPFGRVVVEGMLAARPVVATRAGGVVEILRDGETGFLVSPGDPAALVSGLAMAMADAGEGLDVTTAAQLGAREEFTIGAMLRRIEVELEAS